jgi:hypothetical protein
MKFLLIVASMNMEILYPSEEMCDLAAIKFRELYKEAICVPAGIQEEDQMVKMFRLMKEFVENVEPKSR